MGASMEKKIPHDHCYRVLNWRYYNVGLGLVWFKSGPGLTIMYVAVVYVRTSYLSFYP